MEPEYAKLNKLSQIQFSKQDEQGKDRKDLTIMVEIYSTLPGERLTVFPWIELHSGDFQVPYQFPKVGKYQIVLSILNDNVANISDILTTHQRAPY